jgi:cytochrome b6-f complex iron-sulfur subunit
MGSKRYLCFVTVAMFEHLPRERRRVLKALIAGAVAMFIAPFAYAVDKYLSFTGSAMSGASSRLTIGELSEHRSKIIEIAGEPVVVVQGPTDVRAFTATCTHMGCVVRYRPDHSDFYCRCHQGRFDSNGVNVPGTKPPSPLTELLVRQNGSSIDVFLTPKKSGKSG